jgi:hypothetical protein
LYGKTDFFSTSSIAENVVLPAREGAWHQNPRHADEKFKVLIFRNLTLDCFLY